MLFTPQNAKFVMEGKKWQTRRLVKPGDQWIPAGIWYMGSLPLPEKFVKALPTPSVRDRTGRLRWVVGHTYAVQPGRGKFGIGFIRITAIRQERLQDISEDDAIAEGCLGDIMASKLPRDEFRYLWDSINHKSGISWITNPEVWVLTIPLEAS